MQILLHNLCVVGCLFCCRNKVFIIKATKIRQLVSLRQFLIVHWHYVFIQFLLIFIFIFCWYQFNSEKDEKNETWSVALRYQSPCGSLAATQQPESLSAF